MSNLRDFTGKNRRFTGVDSVKLPAGSTGERTTPEGGELRFNTTLNMLEFYNGSAWVQLRGGTNGKATITVDTATLDGSTSIKFF